MKKHFILILLLLLTLITMVESLYAQTTVTISAPDSVGVGETFTTSFNVNNAQNTSAISLSFEFEPTNVICAGKNENGGFLTGGFEPENLTNCENGLIKYDYATFTGKNGSGTLFITTWSALSDGIAKIRFKEGALSDPAANSLDFTPPSELQIIIGNPPPQVQFSTSPQLLLEDANTVSISAIISKIYDKDVFIHFETSGSATLNSDYTLITNTLTIPIGYTNTNQNVVTIINDTDVEQAENIIFSISEATNATISQPSIYTINITDNDLPEVNWSSETQTINESSGNAVITASLNTVHPYSNVSIDYTVTGGSAASGLDYVLSNGSLTIPGNSLSITKSFIIINDEEVEPLENIIITMGNPQNANLGSKIQHTINLTDNDIPLVTFSKSAQTIDESAGTIPIAITMDKQSYTDVTVTFTTSGSASSVNDYQMPESSIVISQGQTSANLSLNIIDDSITCEPSETIIININNLANASFGAITSSTITISQNDPEIEWLTQNQSTAEGEIAVLSVTSCVSIDQPIIVPYSSGGTAQETDFNAGSDTITIPANQQSASLTINILNDGTKCENDETLTLSLQKPSNAYTGTNLNHTINIAKNEPTVQWSSISQNGNEGDNISVQAQMCMAMSQNIDVSLTINGNAIQDNDFTIGTLTIPANQLTASLSLNLIDDTTTCENDENIILTINDNENVYAGSSVNHTVTILQNDPTIQFTSDNQVSNEGSSAILNVASCVSINEDIIIPYSLNGNTTEIDYSIEDENITIPANQKSATLNVSILDDTEKCEKSENLVITLGKPDNAYTGTKLTNEITIPKNDPTVEWTSLNQQASEGDNLIIQAEMCIAMDQNIDINFTVNGASSSDYSAGTLSIPANLTRAILNLTINEDDSTCEPDETIILTINDSLDVYAGSAKNHTITIAANDPVISWSRSEHEITENAGIITLTATTCIENTIDSEIPYTISGTALAGDHSLTNGTFTLKANTLTANLTINIIDDNEVEPDENILVRLGKVDNIQTGSPDIQTITINDNDLPLLSWETASTSVQESTGTIDITISMDKISYTNVSISYNLSGNAQKEDHSLNPGVFTIPAGHDSISTTINITEDTEDELDEALIITLSNPQNALLGTNELAITIVDNDTPVVQFEKQEEQVDENIENVLVNIIMNDISYQDIVVPFSISGSAHTNDYTLNSGTVTIESGLTSTTLTIPVNDDLADEDIETLILTINTPDNATIGSNNSYTLSINDNDIPKVQWSNAQLIVDESTSTLSISVALNITSYTGISVDYRISDGTATQGTDYTLNNGSLTFSSGQNLLNIQMIINNDEDVEPNENIQLILENPKNAESGINTLATIIIRDDDMTQVEWVNKDEAFDESQGTITLEAKLNKISYTDVTVSYALTISGTANTQDHNIISGNFVIPADSINITKSFSIFEDDIDEPDETIILELENPINAILGMDYIKNITINDNDVPELEFVSSTKTVNENIGTAKIVADLTIIPYTDVTVSYTVGGSTDSSDHDLSDSSLTILAGTKSITLNINITDDNIDEPEEDIIISLNSPQNAIIGQDDEFTLNIIDNDIPIVNWSKLTQVIDENAETAILTATLSIPAYTNVFVEYIVSGSADNITDHDLTDGNITFIAGKQSYTISFNIIEDDIVEPHEDILVTLNKTTNASAGNISECTIIIQDNDSPLIAWEQSSMSVLENIGTLTLKAVLDKPSYTDVTVDYEVKGTSDKDIDHDLNNGTLNFPKDITSTSLTINIAESLTLCESKESIIITLNNAEHANLAVQKEFTLWIIDICPNFNMPDSYTVLEDPGSLSVTGWAQDITSATYPQIPMQFNVSNDNESLFANQPDILSNGTLIFEPVQNSFGTANVSVSLKSNEHSSATQTFKLTIISVNDPPAFTLQDTDYNSDEDSGLNIVDDWITNISSGPENESEQTINININNDNSALFSNQPDIDENGKLSFTPAANKNGYAIVTVQLHDNGNTLNGGVQSTSKQFTITVNPINDAPINNTIPDISGLLQKGQLMQSNKGTWDDSLDQNPGNINYTYQWQQASEINGSVENIAGANSQSFTLTDQQIGKWIRLNVSATDDGEGTPSNQTTSASSLFKGPVLNLPFISFAKAQTMPVNEDAGSIIIPIRLGRKNIVEITLPYNVSGDAILGTDYDSLSGNIVIPAGSTSVNITVNILDDNQEEIQEDIIISLDTPANARLGNITQHTLYIKANDLSPEITNLSPDSGYASGGTSVNINGDKFVNGATVTFGGVQVQNAIVISKNLISCIAPSSNSSGAVQVKVTNPGGNYDTSSFTYNVNRSISGKITSAADSSPVSNCLIKISLGNKTWYNFSDLNGDYTIADLPASDQYIASAWPDFESENCYKSQYFNNKDKNNADRLSTLSSNAVASFSLAECDNGLIQGRIYDLSDNPLNGDFIWVEAYSNNLGESKFSLVNENGVYSITGLKSATDYKVCAVWSETAGTSYCYTLPQNSVVGTDVPDICSSITEDNAREIDIQGNTVSKIDIIIDPQCSGGTISGTVRKCNGKPAANVFVFAKSTALNIQKGAITDAFGRYEINGLIPVLSAQQQEKGYVIGIIANGYPTKFYGGNNEQNATRLTTGRTDIDLNLGCYYFSGRITDSFSKAVSSVIILAWSKSESENIFYATSDTNGYYTVTNLKPSNDYIALVVPLNYASQYYNNQSDKDQANLIDISSENKTDINFQVGCGAKLCGRIYMDDINTPATEGISVNISSKVSNTSLDVLTDSDGYYEICDLDPDVDDYVISVILKGYAPAFYNSAGTVYDPENAEPISTSTSCDKDIIIIKGFSIKGKVHYASSNVSGVFVEAYAKNGFGYGKDVTKRIANKNINYELKGLAPGTYEVSIDPQYTFLAETKEIEIIDQDVELDFELQRPSRMIKGTVYNMEAGTKAWISAWSPSVDGKVVEISGPGNIDYTFTGLQPASDYRVKFISTHYPNLYYNQQTQWLNADKIDISSYDAFDIDFTIEVNPIISGTVIFNNGQAGDKAWVVAFSPSKGSEMTEVEFNDPDYEIKVMKADDYEISVWSNIYTANPEKHFIDTNSGNVENVNFTLNTGTYISGTVLDEDGQPVSGITVEASSTSSGSKFATTDTNGMYQINGLENADDYIISVFVSEESPSFFYSTDSTVRNQTLATEISTENGGVQDIDISIINGERICGIVIDEQFKNLSNILIRLESDALKVRHSVRTDSDGNFEFKRLPAGNDYEVYAVPPGSSPYQGQSKFQIKSNVCNLYFILTPAYTISGQVTDNNDEACSQIEIEIFKGDFYRYYRTDSTGNYEINGIPANSGYAMIVTAAGNTAYLPLKEDNININSNITKNITLTPAFEIWGYIKDTNGSPVSDVIVKALSESDPDSLRIATSNGQGYYKIKNVPAGSDYMIKVEPLQYAEQKKTGQTAGTSVDFVLSDGGIISGYVRNSSLSPLEGIYVQISSSYLDKPALTITDDKGYFAFKGLPQNDLSGNLISDYNIMTASIVYLSEEASGKKLGDEINFTLTNASANVITGRVVDTNNSLPPAKDYVRVYLYKEQASGGFVSKVKTDANGEFEFSGLDTNINYQIKFKVLNGAMINQRPWAGNDGPEASRGNSIPISVGSDIEFKFNGIW